MNLESEIVITDALELVWGIAQSFFMHDSQWANDVTLRSTCLFKRRVKTTQTSTILRRNQKQ